MAATGFTQLSLLTQTAYARLLDLLLTVEAGRPAGARPESPCHGESMVVLVDSIPAYAYDLFGS